MRIDTLFLTCGIIVSTLGSFFVAVSFFKTKNDACALHAKPFYGLNVYFYESLIEQRDMACFGFIFMVLGYILQFCSAIIPSLSEYQLIKYYYSYIIYSIVIILSITMSISIRKFITKRNINKVTIPHIFDMYNNAAIGIPPGVKDFTASSEKQQAILDETKESCIDYISNNLNIKSRKLSYEDFEKKVIEKANKFCERNNLSR